MSQITARLDSLEGGQLPERARGDSSPAPAGDPRTDSLAAGMAQINQRLERMVARAVWRASRRHQRTARATISLRCVRPRPRHRARHPRPPPIRRREADRVRGSAAQRVGDEPGDQRHRGHPVRVPREGESPQVVPREFELAFQANLDPYSATKIFVSFEDGEVSIEEGYIYWTGLPAHLRVDVGVFRQEVGDLNRWHLHALPESEYPLVYRSYLGPDGLDWRRSLPLHRAAVLDCPRHPRSLAPGHVGIERPALRRRAPPDSARAGSRTSGS